MPNSSFPAFLLAAPSSGSGKTTITLALLRLLAQRGMVVQPFKCGPDYLDTRLHAIAASCGEHERMGINLDSFMSSSHHVQELFADYTADTDVAVVEGVMGLFDGAEKWQGSSAEIAILLNIPVIMVLNAQSIAYSAAPLLHGFKNFNPSLNVAGVIFNKVNSASHYRFLEEAALDVGVEPLGYVPNNETITIHERHLGLNTSSDYDRDAVINAMAAHVAQTVSIDRLLEITTIERPAQLSTPSMNLVGDRKWRIAVARDEAFHFLYHHNMKVLEQYGELCFFSPLHDERLPEADLVYIAGGYPELYAEQLAANSAMRQTLHDFSQKGGRIYGECGGMMYLGNSMTLADGTRHAMCSVLDLETTMQEARLTLGYRLVEIAGCPLTLRGHEFHYSRISRQGELRTIAVVKNARNEQVATPLFQQGNTIASYLHLYWGEEHEAPKVLFSLTSP